jgi:hypothetical protein
MIMQLKRGLVIVVIAATAFTGTASTAQTPAPTSNVTPIQKNARILAPSEVESILGSQFVVVRKVGQVPPTLKQSFTNFTGLPFDMNDPGGRIGTDFIIAGLSSRRLVFAALGDTFGVLVYEQGGFATTLNATVFSYVDGGAWRAILLKRPVDNVPALKIAVGNGQFRILEKRN